MCWLHWEAGPMQDAQPLSFASPDYIRPTPTPRSGYHRYQFRLYRQPANATIALTREESISFCKDQLCGPPTPNCSPRGFLGVRVTLCVRAFPKRHLGDARLGQRDLESLHGTWLGCQILCESAQTLGKISGNGLASGIGRRERSLGHEIGPSPGWHVRPGLHHRQLGACR